VRCQQNIKYIILIGLTAYKTTLNIERFIRFVFSSMFILFPFLVCTLVYIFTSMPQKLSENMQICLGGSVILQPSVQVQATISGDFLLDLLDHLGHLCNNIQR
jgi:hypothetical protein